MPDVENKEAETANDKDEQETPETDDAATQGEASAGETGKDGQPFDAERAKALIEKLRTENKNFKTAAGELAKLKKEQAEAEKKSAEEQGKFKELYEKAQAEAQEAKDKAAKIERELLVERIGVKHKLPAELRGRLQGDDEEALEKDAELLAKLIPANAAAPDLDAQKRGSSDAIATAEESAKIAQMYGVPA